MAKRKRMLTSKVIAKRLKEGRGAGQGRDYKPMLYIQDVASRGRAHRTRGLKTGRIHHTLSDLETAYLSIVEWSPSVTDIREQFPLDQTETLAIAEECRVLHPRHPRAKEPVVMTTDFLITVRKGLATTNYARNIKYAGDLEKRRVIEKLEIERLYWQRRGIDWGIVTERDIPRALAENIERICDYISLESRGIDERQIDYIAIPLTLTVLREDAPLSKIVMDFDQMLGLPAGTCLAVAYHLIATRRWTISLQQPLSPGNRLVLLHVTGELKAEERALC